MALHNVPHYLRSHRKRAGLSQEEMAWLLGGTSGTKVSRYERFARRPTLETGFAYEAVFGVPASELFAGTFSRVRQATAKRAVALARRIETGAADRFRDRKLELLTKIGTTEGNRDLRS